MQPVTTSQIANIVRDEEYADRISLSDRAIRDILSDMETMGLVETWVESQGRDGRVKHVQTIFDPQWIRDLAGTYLEQTDQVSPEDITADSEDRSG